jgi:hypothetical protein
VREEAAANARVNTSSSPRRHGSIHGPLLLTVYRTVGFTTVSP